MTTNFGQKITVLGPSVSPNLALRQSQSDDVDDAAMAFGSRLLLRIDPRDIRRDAGNPTGVKRVHYMAPNRDPAIFMGSGISVAAISGKYDGKEVFALSNAGTEGAGTHNDFAVHARSLIDVTEFTMFGVGHFDADLIDQDGMNPLVTMWRNSSSREATIAHVYSGGVNYISIYADHSDGNGANHVLDDSITFSEGVPFAYCWIVRSSGNWRSRLYINQVNTALLEQGSLGGSMDAGTIEVHIGHTAADLNQWPGGHGRGYIISGNALDTAENTTLSQNLMLELMTHYGIS